MDEDVHFGLSHAIRTRGYDVEHTQERDRKGLSDYEQLLYAIAEERCLFSFNVRDFVILHNRYIDEGKEHYGIIVSKQITPGDALKKVLPLLQTVPREEMKNRLEFL